jgi:hypothetical protein
MADNLGSLLQGIMDGKVKDEPCSMGCGKPGDVMIPGPRGTVRLCLQCYTEGEQLRHEAMQRERYGLQE